MGKTKPNKLYMRLQERGQSSEAPKGRRLDFSRGCSADQWEGFNTMIHRCDVDYILHCVRLAMWADYTRDENIELTQLEAEHTLIQLIWIIKIQQQLSIV